MIKPAASPSFEVRPREITGKLFANFPALAECQVCNFESEVTALHIVSDAKTIYRSCRVCEKTRLDMGFTPTEFYLQRVALLDDARRRADAFYQRERERELADEMEDEWEDGCVARYISDVLARWFQQHLRSAVQTLIGPADQPGCHTLGRLTVVLAAFAFGALPIAILIQLFPPESVVRSGLSLVGFLSGLSFVVIALQYSRPVSGRGKQEGQ